MTVCFHTPFLSLSKLNLISSPFFEKDWKSTCKTLLSPVDLFRSLVLLETSIFRFVFESLTQTDARVFLSVHEVIE